MGQPIWCRKKGVFHCDGMRHCKPCRSEYMREYRKTHPAPESQRVKANARAYANTYFRRGKLAAEPCRCGSYDVEKHHEDYSRPLDVTWLCRDCHLALHRAARAGSP